MEIEPIFSIGTFMVTPYSLAAAAACLAAVCVFYLCGKKQKLTEKTLDLTALLGILLGIFLGHFLYAAVKLRTYLADEGAAFLFTPWRGGFMFFGVIAGAALAAAVSASGKDAFRKTLNSLTPALTLLIAALRFIEPLCGQGCGEDTEIAFFPLSYAMDPEWPDERSAAIFFWAGLYGLICFIVLFRYLRKRPDGLKTAQLGLILYCAGEILLESLRRDQVIKWSFVRVNQLISAVILALFVLYALTTRRLKTKKAIGFTSAIAVLIGGCIALEFAVDKPLHLGDKLIYFADWVVYTLLGICGALMGLLAWNSIKESNTAQRN